MRECEVEFGNKIDKDKGKCGLWREKISWLHEKHNNEAHKTVENWPYIMYNA